MNIYSIQYKTLDSKDLRRILNNYEDLILPAKKALIELLETIPEKEEFDQIKIEAVKSLIEEETEEIKNLEYLDWLGIGIIEKPDEIVIKRNKMAKSRDIWGIIIGSLLSLSLFLAFGSIVQLFSEFATGTLVAVVIFSVIGGAGVSLLTKSIDRSLNLKKFRLRKNKQEIILKSCPETMLKQENFSLDLKLTTKQINGYTFLILQNGEEAPIDILKFNELEPVLKETLEYIAQKFNNWQ